MMDVKLCRSDIHNQKTIQQGHPNWVAQHKAVNMPGGSRQPLGRPGGALPLNLPAPTIHIYNRGGPT
jgi:hypothetical protein